MHNTAYCILTFVPVMLVLNICRLIGSVYTHTHAHTRTHTHTMAIYRYMYIRAMCTHSKPCVCSHRENAFLGKWPDLLASPTLAIDDMITSNLQTTYPIAKTFHYYMEYVCYTYTHSIVLSP